MTYTENEIKEWFELMIKEYPNSALAVTLTSIEFMMFNEKYSNDTLKKVLKKD